MRVLILTTILGLLVYQPVVAGRDYIVGLKTPMVRRGIVKRELRFINAYVATLTDEQLNELIEDPRIRFVEEDSTIYASDVQQNAPWNLARLDQRGISWDTNYQYVATGEDVTVYVIDTGVWLQHPDFEGRATAGIGDHSDIQQCNGHGTHVAGIIGARTYGVAKKASIVSLRIFPCGGSTSVSELVAAIEWIANQRVEKNRTRVANISITGAGQSPSVNDALDAVRAKKVVVAVAAGNGASDACLYFPAGFPRVLTVGATAYGDDRALYSNYGSCVDVFAPGDSILSTWNRSDQPSWQLSGTSMAAPHVAGVAALYLQDHRRASVEEVEAAIITAATSGALNNIGFGSPNLLVYSLF